MLIDIKIPPGISSNGTKYQNRGRWVDGNLVRFKNGTVRPVGGWGILETPLGVEQTTQGKARALLTWFASGGGQQLAIGTTTKLYGWTEGAMTDITPGDLVTATQNSGFSGSGFGDGDFGEGAFGVGPGSSLIEADVWQLDTYGDFLVACLPSDGRILLWDRNPANDAAEIDADAPTSCFGVVVTPERFVVALGAGGDRRKVEWCDQENYAVWDAASPGPGSQAGDFILEGEGAIMAGRRSTKETLIWTTAELFAMRYIGIDAGVYAFEKVGSDCGLISPQGVATVGTRAVWMGRNGFFIYDGYVRPLPCEVHDYVFSDFETTQAIKVNCFTLADQNEVWWLYPSAGSQENDRYVVWNWEENHWTVGALDRAAGCDRGPFDYPFMVSSLDGTVFEHERGWTHIDGDTNATIFIESAPIQIGDGDRLVNVDYVVPDERNLGRVEVYAYTANYPTATETLRGPYSMTEPTAVRWTARQVRLRLVERTDIDVDDWRYGVVRLDAKPGSRR